MTVITISYAPDFELCVALKQSLLENSPNTIQHHIIVPRSDLELFQRLADSRSHIICEADFLPRSFVRVPPSNMMINLRRPFPPVRGWIQQQIIKLAAIAASDDDVVLTVDSDVEFIRPFSAEMFVRNGAVRSYRGPNQIGDDLSRHIIWYQAARDLLGLPPSKPPYPDYISSFLAWDPKLVRRMLAHVEDTTGQPWATAIAGQLHFSECILYGVFIDGVVGACAKAFHSNDSLCLSYWDQTPLNLTSAADFIDQVRPTDIAVLIQSKSRTPPTARKAILDALRAVQSASNSVPEPSEIVKPGGC